MSNLKTIVEIKAEEISKDMYSGKHYGELTTNQQEIVLELAKKGELK